jgi:hypothetical protein
MDIEHLHQLVNRIMKNWHHNYSKLLDCKVQGIHRLNNIHLLLNSNIEYPVHMYTSNHHNKDWIYIDNSYQQHCMHLNDKYIFNRQIKLPYASLPE